MTAFSSLFGSSAAGSPGGLAQPKKTGLYRTLFPTSTIIGSTQALNNIYMVPFGIPANKTYTFSGCAVNFGGAGNIRFAIASSDAAGDPASILFESGAINAGGAGVVTASVSLAITTTADSLYWLAAVTDTSSIIYAMTYGTAFAGMNWGMPAGAAFGVGTTLLKARTYATGAIVIGDLTLSGYSSGGTIAPGVQFKWTET